MSGKKIIQGLRGAIALAKGKKAAKRTRFYSLDHKKHGVGGVSTVKPTKRKQDRRALSSVRYAMVFFPKVHGIGVATLGWDTPLVHRRETAPVVFMDGIGVREGETLKQYEDAGWRLRKIKIVDLGDV